MRKSKIPEKDFRRKARIFMVNVFAVSLVAALILMGQATGTTYIATLNSSQANTNSTASGIGIFEIDINANILSFNIQFSGLSGNEIQSYIYGPAAPGENAAPLFNLTHLDTPKVGAWKYEEADEANILAGLTYITIHSSHFPDGEIRGQILPASPQNSPPHQPRNPSPGNGAVNQSINLSLSWSGGDPDGDTVTYSVYLDTDPDPTTLKCMGTSPSCSNFKLLYSATYFWKVIANDGNLAAEGSVWNFTTRASGTELPSTGNISVTSSPSGAQIFVDDEYKGKASPTLKVPDVAPGNHTLKCGFSGYQDHDANVTVVAGSTANVTCMLSPIPTPALIPGTAPSSTQTVLNQLEVLIASHPPHIEPGQISTITVTVTGSDGNAISGASVMLDSIPAGILDQGSGTTNPFGRFTSTFTAPATGNATVEAIAKKEGFADGKGNLQLAISTTPVLGDESGINLLRITFVLLGAAALVVLFLWTKGTMQLIFTQLSMPCDGKSTLPIKVQFVNAFGKLIKQRKDRVVEMEATSGRIQNIVIPAGRESGEAMLTSSKENGPVTISAKSGRQKATAQVDFVCDEAGLDVEISPASIPADGKSTATASIRIIDDKGDYITSLKERTVDLSITIGTITNPVKIPPKTAAGTAVIKAGKMSGTSKVMAACPPFNDKGTMITGEGRIIFTEPAKRYCMHCGTSMTMDTKSCPLCGKTPPSGIDTRMCSDCNTVLPLSATFCSTCGVRQKM